MKAEVLAALEARRPTIRANWESLLRLEKVTSPLANPDTLVHLIDRTLDELFADLRLWSVRRHPTRAPAPDCPCGRNPHLAYFAAGRQALREGLIMVETEAVPLEPADRDLCVACLDQAYSHIERREIEAFCAVCQLRPATCASRWRWVPDKAGVMRRVAAHASHHD